MVVTRDTILEVFDFAFSVLAEQVALLTRDVFSDQGPTKESATQLQRQTNKITDTFEPLYGFLKLGVERYSDLESLQVKLGGFLNKLEVIRGLLDSPSDGPTVSQACREAADMLREMNLDLRLPIYQGLIIHISGDATEKAASAVRSNLTSSDIELEILKLPDDLSENALVELRKKTRGRNLVIFIADKDEQTNARTQTFNLGFLLGGMKSSNLFYIVPDGSGWIDVHAGSRKQLFTFPVGDPIDVENSFRKICCDIFEPLGISPPERPQRIGNYTI